MCFHIKPFFLPVDTQHSAHTPRVRADSFPRDSLEIYKLCVSKSWTEIYQVYLIAVKGGRQCDVMPSCCLRQAQHTHASNPDTLKEGYDSFMFSSCHSLYSLGSCHSLVWLFSSCYTELIIKHILTSGYFRLVNTELIIKHILTSGT